MWKFYVNEESYNFRLKGTQPLEITSLSPSGELFTSSPILKVFTNGGAEGGVAICGYTFDEDIDPVEFLRTNSTIHEQPFSELKSGDYDAAVTCVDAAGNFVLTPGAAGGGAVSWNCTASTIADKYLPANCR